ncbi:MAG: FtsW/RodA/SpoVE family cell cycle protein [Endomicrobiia bacterium]
MGIDRKYLSIKKETNIIKKVIDNSNWRLIASVFLLTLTGIVMIYSATFFSGNLNFVAKQIIAFLIGVILLVFLSIISYQTFQPYYFYIYLFCIFLLILVLFVGSTYRNTKAWIDLKLFLFQPSEIVRILFILAIAGYMDIDYIKITKKIAKFFVSIIAFSVIVILLILENDFSAVVVYFPILITVFYLSGINKKFLNYILSFFVITVILFLTKSYLVLKEGNLFKLFRWFLLSLTGLNKYYFFSLGIITAISILIWWILKRLLFRVSIYSLLLTIFIIYVSYSLVAFSHKFIKSYQNKRIIGFLNPYIDPAGCGYQVIQTKVAIGSGRIFGKGIFQSTQAKLGFVPEKHTDFIFSLIGEELGFLGTSIVIFLYLIIILEGIKITFTSIDTYGSLVAGSITAMFGFYFFVNTGMCLGILPVVGLPLPFVSYGGSNLVASYMAVGILNSINIRKFLY